jgi:streptogrisin C
MLRKAPTAAGTVLAAGLLALTAPPALPAGADDPGPPASSSAANPPEIAPGMLAAVSHDLRISSAQARIRMANEQRAIPVERSLRARLGTHYAGAWVSGATAKLVVATTDRRQVRTITEAGARAKVVRHSLADLTAAQKALDKSARKRAARGTAVWAVDVRGNRVLVRASEPGVARDFVTRSGAVEGLVRVVRSTERPRTYADLRGGDAFYAGSARCSIGFAVTKGTRSGFVTAGHCGRRGTATKGYNRHAQGTFQGSSFPGNDYAWVTADSGWKATGYVKGPGGTNVSVSGSDEVPVGSSVCRSGSTSGWHCGTVQQHGASVTYSQGTVYGVTRTSVCADAGDSGGPFVSGSQAQGTTSGGTGDCSLGGTTYFQPIGEALRAYGLRLSTS